MGRTSLRRGASSNEEIEVGRPAGAEFPCLGESYVDVVDRDIECVFLGGELVGVVNVFVVVD